MKRQMINHEQLRFPTGIATAETLRSLYSRSGESLKQAWALIIALFGGLVVGTLHNYSGLAEQLKDKAHFTPKLAGLLGKISPDFSGWLERCLQGFSVWIGKASEKFYLPDLLNFTGSLNPLARGQMTGLGFEPSLLLSYRQRPTA